MDPQRGRNPLPSAAGPGQADAVGDLDKDTALTILGEGRSTIRLSEDWAIWGPNGGYVASVALRAAGLASGRERPASLLVHMLGVAAFDEVDVTTTVLRTSRFATAVRVGITQGDQPILDGMAWGVDSGGVTLEHEVPTMPADVPPPDELLSHDDRMAALGDEAPPAFKFWENIEHRPLLWHDEWPPPQPVEPIARWWQRFRPTPTFDEAWLDACRLLIPIDTMGWPAAHLAHAHDDPAVIAPTVDLSVRFHRPAFDDEWLLAEAISPVATGGLVAASGRVWNRQGQLLASGGQTMLCRPAFRPPAG
jgi:acyl-CoA thioesterase II